MNWLIIIIVIIIILVFYYINHSLKRKIMVNEYFSNQKQNQIPKIIIQTWKTKAIPDRYKEDVKSISEYNKDFTFLFFNDDEIDLFLKEYYPQYYESYNKLPVKIQKIDYFRYIAIYHYGGFYFDLDMRGLYPLEDLLDYECIFPIDQHITPQKCDRPRLKTYCKAGMKILLGQYAFAARAQNEFIKLLIDTIHNNIDKYLEDYKNRREDNKLQYVYSSTGPDFVTDVYMKYKHKDTIHILYHEDAQYFGKYAKHNHYGTWK
jgi:mannosyltransferase OCH1-like enzyme